MKIEKVIQIKKQEDKKGDELNDEIRKHDMKTEF